MRLILKSIFFISLLTGLAAFKMQAVSDISSAQEREDGNYNVLCKDGKFEVVSSDDIASNNVCPHVVKAPSNAIQNGTYEDTSGTLCTQKLVAKYRNNMTLESIRMDFAGCSGDYLEATCTNNVCTGISYGQNIRVTVQDATHYLWENLVYTDSVGHFERVGDLNVLVQPPISSSHTMGAGVAGALP
ncbi:hypothetical protein [Bdellovibrio sp. HCB337]|uniref:hypothetical protein n=1 Tax=Bdellovibrio sp. HCB337 TaxID=3394358 RepID=UPI0039A77344